MSVCERMGWTFSEYDATPAVDMYQAFELWRLEEAEKRRKNPQLYAK